jgi:hypothetical protein
LQKETTLYLSKKQQYIKKKLAVYSDSENSANFIDFLSVDQPCKIALI